MTQKKTQGTIAIIDVTEIADIYTQYARAIENANVTNSYSFSQTGEISWSTSVPEWIIGFEIWKREVVVKEGVSQPEYGTPVKDSSLNQIQSKLRYIWVNLDNTQYPAGTYAASGNSQPFDATDSDTYGFNSYLTNGALQFRYNDCEMADFSSSNLTFYRYPVLQNNTLVRGNKGIEINSNGLNLYDVNENVSISINSQTGIQIGKTAEPHINLTSSGGINFYDANDSSNSNLSITSNSIKIGKTNTNYINIDSGSISFIADTGLFTAYIGKTLYSNITNTSIYPMNFSFKPNTTSTLTKVGTFYLPFRPKTSQTFDLVFEFGASLVGQRWSATFTGGTASSLQSTWSSSGGGVLVVAYDGDRTFELNSRSATVTDEYFNIVEYYGAYNATYLSRNVFGNIANPQASFSTNNVAVAIGQQISTDTLGNYIPNSYIRVDSGSIRINNNEQVRNYLSSGTPAYSGSTIHGSLFINGRDMFSGGRILYYGTGHLLGANTTASLSEPISAQPHGIVLAWSGYSNGTADEEYTFQFIPKYYYFQLEGRGNECWSGQYQWYSRPQNAVSNSVRNKYFKVYDGYFEGTSYNTSSGTGYFNDRLVLRYVIGI